MRRCIQQPEQRRILSSFISMELLSWPQCSGKIVVIHHRRQETSVRADIEGEVSSTIISSIPVTSLCGLSLGVVKEDAFVTALFFTFYDLG
jgi:hypothetical protein